MMIWDAQALSDIAILSTKHHQPIILLLQVCHRELMQWPPCVLQRVEGDEVEKLEQHSIENHSHIAQWVEQLTCISGGRGFEFSW